MFLWVNYGIHEPYVPKIIHEPVVKKVHSLHQDVPTPLIDEHKKDSPTTESQKKPEKVADFYAQSATELKKESRRRVFYAAEIMSKPVEVLNESESIEIVEDLFRLKRFRHVPVVNSKKTLVGIISDRDMLSISIEKNRNKDFHKNISKVSDIMKTKVLTALPETDIRDIAKIMFQERIGSIPVVDKNEMFVKGIITRSDILRSVMNQPALEIWS